MSAIQGSIVSLSPEDPANDPVSVESARTAAVLVLFEAAVVWERAAAAGTVGLQPLGVVPIARAAVGGGAQALLDGLVVPDVWRSWVMTAWTP